MLIILVGMVVGCRPSVPEPPTLRLGHALHDHHAALFVAATYPGRIRTAAGAHLIEREFAQRYDLVNGSRMLAQIRVDASTGGVGLIRRLAEDQLDLSFGSVPAMLVQIDRGASIRIVSPVMRDGAGLVISKALPVQSWADFAAYAQQRVTPLRIGYKAELSVQNLVFEQRLRDAGVQYSRSLDAAGAQIILVNLSGPQNLIPALRHGLIDGFVSMQPYLSLAEADGVGRLVALISGMSGAAYPCCALAAREEVISKHGDTLASFVELMRAATAFLYEEPALSAEALSVWLGTTPEIERRSLPTTHFSMTRDAVWDQGVRQWREQLLTAGLLEGVLASDSDGIDLLERICGPSTEASLRAPGK